jgi:serine/threonine protein kinase
MGQAPSVDSLGDWSLLTLWALGYGSPSAASASLNKFVLVPSPDALFASLSLLFIGAQLAAQRGTRLLSRRGDEAASARVFLPIFVTLLRRLALGLGLIFIFAIATLLCERYPFEKGEFLHVPVNFLRIFFIELVTHTISLVFLQPSLSIVALERALIPAAVWASLFALVNASLMIAYDPGGSNELTGSSGRIPRLILSFINGFIAIAYFVVVFVRKLGRAALRPYALYTILWRSLVCVGLILACILVPETYSNDDDNTNNIDNVIKVGVARRDLCITFDLVFMLVQVIGFPVAIFLTVTADTFYWRGGARLLPEDSQDGSRRANRASFFNLLYSSLCGMGDLGLGLGLRGFGRHQRKNLRATSQTNFCLYYIRGLADALFSFFRILFGIKHDANSQRRKRRIDRQGVGNSRAAFRKDEDKKDMDDEESDNEFDDDDETDDNDDIDDIKNDVSNTRSPLKASSKQKSPLLESLLNGNGKEDRNRENMNKNVNNAMAMEEVKHEDKEEWGISSPQKSRINNNENVADGGTDIVSSKKKIKKSVSWKYSSYRPNLQSPEALAARVQGITQFLRWSKERHLLGNNEVVDLLMDLLDRCASPSYALQPRVLDFAFLRLNSLEYRGLEVSVFKGRYKNDKVAVKVATPIMALDVDLMKKVAAEADMNLLLIRGYDSTRKLYGKRRKLWDFGVIKEKEMTNGRSISTLPSLSTSGATTTAALEEVALPPTERTALKSFNRQVYSGPMSSNTSSVRGIFDGEEEENENEDEDEDEGSEALSRDPSSFSHFSPTSCSGLIPAFKGVCCCPPDISLVYEWCSGGTLRDFLDASVFETVKLRQQLFLKKNATANGTISDTLPLPLTTSPASIIFPTVKFLPIASSKWTRLSPPADWKDDIDSDLTQYMSSGKLIVQPVRVNDEGQPDDSFTMKRRNAKMEKEEEEYVLLSALRSRLRSSLWVVGGEPSDVDLFPPDDPFSWPVSDVPLMQMSWQWSASLVHEDMTFEDEEDLDEEEEDDDDDNDDYNDHEDKEGIEEKRGLKNECVPPSYLQRLAFALQVSRALAYLHAFSPALLHRDVKSPNIFLTTQSISKFRKHIQTQNDDLENLPSSFTSTRKESIDPEDFTQRAEQAVSQFPLKALLGDFGDCKPLRKGASSSSHGLSSASLIRGNSSSFRSSSRTPMTRETGTPQWMAPEVMVVVGEHNDALEELHEVSFQAAATKSLDPNDVLVSEEMLLFKSGYSIKDDDEEKEDEEMKINTDDEENQLEINIPDEKGDVSYQSLPSNLGDDEKKTSLKNKNHSNFMNVPFSRTGLHAAWYSTPADVFSFATILWELVTGGTPYTGLTKKAQVVLIVSRHHARPLIPPQCPLALAQLIRRCWHPDPSCRPSAAFASIVLQRLLEEGLRLWKEVGRGKKRQERRGAKMKKSRTVAI